MDHEGGCVVLWGLLQVDDHEPSTILNSAKRHIAGRGHSHAGTHSDAEIRDQARVLTVLKDFTPEVLSKVDDGVSEIAIAARGVALAPSLVILGLLSIAHSEVSHVLAIAIGANLKVSVPVQVSKLVRVDPTLAMKTVDVLRNARLQDASIH